MAGEIVSTTTTLNDLLPSIVAEAMFAAQEQSIMRGLVRNYDLPYGSGTTITVPKYNAVAAAGLTEADDLSGTAVSTDGATLTVGEVGVMTNVSDLSVRTSPNNVIADVGQVLGNAIAKKMDQDLIALFDGFSVALGDGTTTITVANIFNAVTKLKALGLGLDRVACVLHPNIAYDLMAGATNTTLAAFGGGAYGEIGNTAMRSGYLGQLAGIPIYESANITDTTGDSIGAVFHRDALGLAVLDEFNIEPQRDASARATELVATARYGVGELNDTYGVELNFDSTLLDAA